MQSKKRHWAEALYIGLATTAVWLGGALGLIASAAKLFGFSELSWWQISTFFWVPTVSAIAGVVGWVVVVCLWVTIKCAWDGLKEKLSK